MIADIAVFGVPDSEWGERLVAVVELVDAERDRIAGPDGELRLRKQILGAASAELAAYKMPRELYFAGVGRNAAGKVPLAALRAQYTADCD